MGARSRSALALGLALGLVSATAACGGGDPARTGAQLDAVLLAPADLGEGWTQTQRQVFTERGPEHPSIDPSVWCPAAEDDGARLVKLAGSSGADVELEGAGGDPVRLIRQQAWSNGDARTFFRTVVAAVTACRDATWQGEDGSTATFTVLTAPTTGEEAVSFSVEATIHGTDGDTLWQARHVVARTGSTVMVLDGSEIRPATGAPAGTWWSGVVDAAGTKLARLGKS